MKIYDISMEIQENMMVYPGDPQATIQQIKKIPENSANASKLCLGSHTGSHLDCKRHISNDGIAIDMLPLEQCCGPCQVLDVTDVEFGEGVTKKQLKKSLIHKNDIILLKTKNSSRGFKEFKSDFVYLAEDGAQFLVDHEIKAVGIDSLSIEKFRCGSNTTHRTLLDNNVIIFEGLDLSGIAQNNYFFVGFPLKINNGDGSPIRTVLIEGL